MNNRFTQGLKAIGLATVLTLGLAAAATVDAHPRGRVDFGVWVGGPFWWPGMYYGYPYVVERPVIVQQPVEPMVVQPSATQQANTWYYCREAQMYYPYVASCPSAWQEVPATPPPAAPAIATPAPTPAPATRTPAAPVPPAPSK